MLPGAGEDGHGYPTREQDQPEIDQPVGEHRGQRLGRGHAGRHQRGGESHLDQAEPARRDPGAAGRGTGTVGEDQAPPWDRLAGGADRTGEAGAVGQPVERSQPEDFRVTGPFQPDAGQPGQELVQGGRVDPGLAEHPPGEPDQVGQGLVGDSPGPRVAQGQQDRHRGQREHRGPGETGQRGDGRPAGERARDQDERQRRR
jgi:hypothetical protein